MSFDELNRIPHRRFNALTREWVLVSPHRTQRPWQGQVERAARVERPRYDPACYLCPGNERAGGKRIDEAGLLVAEGERGQCRVLCFSPDHSLTLARMDVPSITNVVETWAEQ